MGPLAYEKREGPVFLGMSQGSHREYSETKAEEIDAEVYRFVNDGYQKALKIVRDNVDILHRLTEALLDRETIDGSEVELIIKGGTLDDLRRERESREREMAKEQAAGRKEMREKSDKAEDAEKGGTEPIGNAGPVTA